MLMPLRGLVARGAAVRSTLTSWLRALGEAEDVQSARGGGGHRSASQPERRESVNRLRAMVMAATCRRSGVVEEVLNLRTTTSQKCAVVPRRARI